MASSLKRIGLPFNSEYHDIITRQIDHVLHKSTPDDSLPILSNIYGYLWYQTSIPKIHTDHVKSLYHLFSIHYKSIPASPFTRLIQIFGRLQFLQGIEVAEYFRHMMRLIIEKGFMMRDVN
jgi:hypothetical protein